MDCFTSPTIKRFSPPRETAEKMAFCTALVSWYSSTMISSYRAAYCAATPPSERSFTARCSRSAKSSRPRRAFSAAYSASKSFTSANRARTAG